MKLVRTMAFGVAALGFGGGAALAQEDPMAAAIDSYLFIEESDTRG